MSPGTSTIRRVGILALLIAAPLWPQKKDTDLAEASLEDLMNTQVTSVSKKEQKLSRVAAAIFVITQEDIRRSGALNIPDLLRIVPGMDVAQINANTWAISARGFNERFTNELLVMVDGRNVYTPTFGGVYWEVLDPPLEDVERIEVIRGPGGSVWGGNAVNGVISIVTKKAAASRGALAVAGAGNLEQGFGTLQYGGALGKSTNYRIYTKYFNDYHMPGRAGQNGGDGWHVLRGGFRLDSALSAKDTFMAQGDLYTGREEEITTLLPAVTAPALQDVHVEHNLSGGYLQADWNHAYSARSDTTLRTFLDRYTRNDALRETRNTVDLDFQHHVAWGERQDLVWGLGYRYTASATNGNFSLSLNPANLNTQLFSSFIQDEFALVPGRLYLTVGTKLEHNDYTGFELWPSARVAYAPSDRQMFWAAVSRAARTPASIDTAIRANLRSFPGPGGIPVLNRLTGNPAFKDEGLIAYEVGYRTTVLAHLSIDLAAYYNAYDSRQTIEPSAVFFETTPPPPHLVLPLVYHNLMHGETHGLEIAAKWRVTDRWTLSPGCAFERIHMHLDPTSQSTDSVADGQGSSPVTSAQLQSHLDLPYGLGWGVSAAFVDRLPVEAVPSYTRLDTQFTWRWMERVSVDLVGQNLLRDHHLEFNDPNLGVNSALIKRSAYAKLTWRF